MSTEHRTSLTSDTISHLQTLIQLNIDSEKGLLEAADNIEEMSIRGLFTDLASQRREQAYELQTLVSANAETPQDSGSMSAALHRAWMDIRSAVGGGVTAMLQEAERGEDYIKDKYEEILKDASPAIRDLLQRQYAAVKLAHDRIRDMRDAREAMR